MMVGPWQLFVIVLLLAVIFWANRLGDIGRNLGQGARHLKKALTSSEPDRSKRPLRRRHRDGEPRRTAARGDPDRSDETRQRRHVPAKGPEERS